MNNPTGWSEWYREAIQRLNRAKTTVKAPEFDYEDQRNERWRRAFGALKSPAEAVAEAVAEENTGSMFQ